MTRGISLSSDGVKLERMFKSQSFSWEDIVASMSTSGTGLAVTYRDPTAQWGHRIAHLDRTQALEVLHHPKFPKTSLSRYGAELLGLPLSEIASFGPPAGTMWLRGGPEKAVWQAIAAKIGRPDSLFVPVVGVGVWSGGVAFDLGVSMGIHGERIVPWPVLDPWPRPALDGCFQFGWPPRPNGPSERYLVTAGQAHSILEFPSGRAWGLSPEARASLGMK